MPGSVVLPVALLIIVRCGWSVRVSGIVIRGLFGGVFGGGINGVAGGFVESGARRRIL